MQGNITLDQFNFRHLVKDALEHCKKYIKSQPFEEMDIDGILETNTQQRIDLYHQHLIIGISNLKTRQRVAQKYDALINENLINKDFLPPQMITSLLNARPSAGSTASSGSMHSSSQIQFERSIEIGGLIRTIICKTIQPAAQIQAGLNFMLEGTRTKNYGHLFVSQMQEIYLSLVEIREKPIDRFLNLFLKQCANEAEYHLEDKEFSYKNRAIEEKQNKICVHGEVEGKFGKCWMCEKDAKNYDKALYVGLCSIDCKKKLKNLRDQCNLNDHFNLFSWLLESLPQGDQIIFQLFVREVGSVSLTRQRIWQIFLIISSHFCLEGAGTIIQKSSVYIFLHLVEKYHLISSRQFFQRVKVFIIELIRIIQMIPISQISEQKLYLIEGLVTLLVNEQVLTYLYLNCDCSMFEIDVIDRMLNIISQYALSEQFRDFGIASIYKFIHSLTRMPKSWLQQHSIEKKLKQKRMKKELQTIIQRFNKKPEKGIQKLKNMFDNKISTREIAIFIRQNLDYEAKIKKKKTLQKDKVGEYFGTKGEEIQSVLYEFLNLFDFKNMEVDDHLRILFNLFTLPKEGQQIERIFNTLSMVLEPHLGLEPGNGTYQFISAVLMVNTSKNPNVREKDKIKIDDFKNLCRYVEGGVPEERVITVFNRVTGNPLENLYQYRNEELFENKHLVEIKYRSEEWLEDDNIDDHPFCSLLVNVWEYLYISIVNKNNLRGMFDACWLYGRVGLKIEFEGFFSNLVKLYQGEKDPLSHEAMVSILRLGVEAGNFTYGVSSWFSIMRIIYRLDQESNVAKPSDYEYQISDRLFTHTKDLEGERLKQFIEAMCEFSSSEFKTDSSYSRQVYILHHVAEVIEYNMGRIEFIWEQIWGCLEEYFRDICLHPRREIAMSAIDSFKQFTIKVFKINGGVDHELIMEVYMHIFQRSNPAMKDLIINILLNVVSKDMRGGWDPLYSILEVADSEDEGVVMRVIHRLITEVGLPRIGNLHRLHQILVKELRVAGHQNEEVLHWLWEVSNFFNQLQVWLETLKCVKDIYKIQKNNNILEYAYRICNKCLEMMGGDEEKQSCMLQQIMEIQIFITEIKSSKTFIKALNKFTVLSRTLIYSHFTKFLSLWELYFNCLHYQHFQRFFVQYLATIISDLLDERLTHIGNKFYLWVLKFLLDSSPHQILELSQSDSDLGLDLQDALKKARPSNKTELIQFGLSSKQYEQKCSFHLTLIEIVQIGYQSGVITTISPSIQEQLSNSIVDSYEMGKKINQKVLIRNFLWENEFLGTETNDYLPSLTKQELRTYGIIVQYYPIQKMEKLWVQMMVEYCQKMKMWKQGSKDENPAHIQRLIYEEIGRWLTNANPLMEKTCQRFIFALQERKKISLGSQIFHLCCEILPAPISRNLLSLLTQLTTLLISQI